MNEGQLTVAFLVGALGFGGIERHVLKLSRRAREGGEFLPEIFCLNGKSGPLVGEAERSGIPVLDVPGGWHRNVKRLRELGNRLRERRIDIVHSEFNFCLVQQLLASRIARASFCVTERNCYPLAGWARLRRVAQFHVLRAAGTSYTANSRAGAWHLADRVLAPPQSIGVLNNGVSIPQPNDGVVTRVSLGLARTDFVIGCVARLVRQKGHSQLLRAVALLRGAGIPAKVLLVGDGPERDAIRRLIAELQIGEDVCTIGAVENVYPFLQASDVVALLSEREGMPNSVLEAMSCARPIVATPVGGIPEALGDSGILVGCRDIQGTADALARLYQNSDLAKALGQAALRRVHRRFSLERAFEDHLNHYREVSGWL